MKHFDKDKKSALEGMEMAQWIAFAPVVFQAARALKNLGILTAVQDSRKKGITFKELHNRIDLSEYALRVLCEAALGIGLFYQKGKRFYITNTGYFFLNDKLTGSNTDFINDVCYKGMFNLENSLKNGKPEGLKVFGSWKTIYEALSSLPEDAKQSWFKFDHFYSDGSFPMALPLVFEDSPQKILDIGGNTGKWAFSCLEFDKEVHITIMDLHGQLEMAKENAAVKGVSDRMSFYEADLLNPLVTIPNGYDVIWMSQFLDCFSDEEIVSILQRCARSIGINGRIFIMETFWDRQQFKTAAFCLQMTSLYFTAIANGNSQMYNSEVFLKLIEKAGLEAEKIYDNIGVSHSLVKCRLA